MSLVRTLSTGQLEALPSLVRTLAAAFLLGYEGATRSAYGRALQSWFGWCLADDVDPLAAQTAHVDAYGRTLAEVPDANGLTRSLATVARHLSTLSGFSRYAVAEDVVARNPVANVNSPKVGTDTVSTGLDKDELAALVRVADADSPACSLLFCCSGSTDCESPRLSEQTSTTLGRSEATLCSWRNARVGKGARPLAPRTAKAIDPYVEERIMGPLFLNRTGERWHRTEAWRTLRRLG
jgi:site-specific recombinase XerC